MHAKMHETSKKYPRFLLFCCITSNTRQLPMGAGHCPWGGYTDRIVCNIHGEVHLASRYRAMLRPGTFSKFGTLPAPLTTCQCLETFLEDAHSCSTTFGVMPNLVGTLPKVPHLTFPGSDRPHS